MSAGILHRIAIAVAALALCCAGCRQAPEARSAKFLEAGKKLMEKNDPAHALLEFRNAAKETPRKAEPYYHVGVAYLQLGDVRNGVSALRQALQIEPRHLQAQVRLAQLMVVANEPGYLKEARQRLIDLLQDSPDDREALHVLALTELRLGQPKEAQQYLARSLAAAPQDLVIAATMAEAKMRQRDLSGAEEDLKKACAASPQSADAWLLLGRFYAALQRPADAEQQFRRALEIAPNHATALYYMAILQDSMGRKPEVEQILKKLAGLPGKDFRHTYAMFLFQEGRRDEALKMFEDQAAQDPEDRMARTRLIVAYRALRRPDEGRKIIDRILEKNPKDVEGLLQRAEMYVEAGKYLDAETDLNQVLHFKPDAAEVHYALAQLHKLRVSPLKQRAELYEALRLNPYLLPARVELVELLLTMTSGAKAALDLVEDAPESQRPDLLVARNWALWALGDFKQMRAGIDRGMANGRTVDLMIQDGMWKLSQNDSNGARIALEEALKINPADLRALTALKQVYATQKQSGVAVQKVKEYAAKQPNSAPVQQFLGLMMWANGNIPQARQAFEAAKTASPSYQRAEMSLAQLDVMEKKWDAARNRLQAVVAADDRNARAHLWLGNLLEFQGNHTGAIVEYRKVLDVEPENPAALNNLGYLLAAYQNQPDEALKYAQKAQEISPNDPDVADTLGWTLYQKGMYTSAVPHLERAAAKDGGNVVWKYHLAMAYAKAGNLQKGRATYEAALKRDPNVSEAAVAKQVLEQTRSF